MKTAESARAKAIELNLRRHKNFDSLGPELFASIYNGIGPDNWPKLLRAALTFVYRYYRALPAVHDVDFYFSDGTAHTWDIVTQNWQYNMGVCLNNRYPLNKFWLYPMRAIGYAKLWLSYKALRAYSLEVYEACNRSAVSGTATA